MHIDMSIVTSVYRGGDFLPVYRRRLLRTAQTIKQADVALEVIIIANDPQPEEDRELTRLEAETDALLVNLQIIRVPRETLYTSWNRGVQAAHGQGITFWNVDDDRTAEALIESAALINDGCELIDFPYYVVKVRQLPFGYDMLRSRRREAFYSNEDHPPPRNLYTGTFFGFHRELYARIGPFDTRFAIVGDSEWQVRAHKAASQACAGESVAGRFFVHGDNLSWGSDRRTAENNILNWMHDGDFKPVAPDVMRETWARFDLPEPEPAIASQLWGTGSREGIGLSLAKLREALVGIVNKEPLLSFLFDVLGLRKAFRALGVLSQDSTGETTTIQRREGK